MLSALPAPWWPSQQGQGQQGVRVTPKGCAGGQKLILLKPRNVGGCSKARVTLLLTFLRGHVTSSGRDSCAQGPPPKQLCSQGGARSHPGPEWLPAGCRFPSWVHEELWALRSCRVSAGGQRAVGGWGRTRRSSRSRRGYGCISPTTPKRRCRCG